MISSKKLWRFAAATTLACLWLFMPLSATAETLLELGNYLVNTIMACGNCHTPKGPDGTALPGRELSGGLTFDTPAFTATAANITPDKETGIGTWSDDEIKQTLTSGMRPAHARLPSVPLAGIMAVNFYKALTPRDLDAIVAYLRSVPPVHNEVMAPVYKLPVHREVYPDAEKAYTEAALHDSVTRGDYLATIGHCMECHSAFVKGISDYVHGLGQGGRELPGGAIAANITSSTKSGIGAWSDAEIKRAITHGIARDGHKMRPPMAVSYYAHLSDADLDAIVAWLRTVPPLE